MYFDGQLSYLDKDKAPSTPTKPSKTAAQALPDTPTPPPLSAHQAMSAMTSSAQKGQTAGPAGDLHSMALKSAISNIGMLPVNYINNSSPFCQKTFPAKTDAIRCLTK